MMKFFPYKCKVQEMCNETTDRNSGVSEFAFDGCKTHETCEKVVEDNIDILICF